MAAATEITANETEIKQAMSVLRLDGWVDDLLDEIELNRELTLSIEEANRGELIPAEEAEKKIERKFTNGHYTKENAKKRIAEKYELKNYYLSKAYATG